MKFGAAGIATCFVLAPEFCAAANPHDGIWNFVLTTRSSACNPRYDWRISVNGGSASGSVHGRLGEYRANGGIDALGRITIGILPASGQGFTGAMHGQADGRKASGTWSASGGPGACTGDFNATRSR